MKWLNGLSLAATFDGAFSDVTRSYAGKGVARYNWQSCDRRRRRTSRPGSRSIRF
jgi:hypothetical protein